MIRQLSDHIVGTLRWLKALPAAQPIADVRSLIEFIHTRSAYVGQTSLYGYLKTRMGTRYRDYFQDDQFAASMRIAAVKVSFGCLEDLTIFAVASAAGEDRLTRQQSVELARYCFAEALDQMIVGNDLRHVPADALSSFQRRINLIDWQRAAIGETAFSRSPEDLVRFAPVADEFKVLDRQIVMNSIRFRWRDIRDRLTRRLEAADVCSDWLLLARDKVPARP